jgi:hypothetical protein
MQRCKMYDLGEEFAEMIHLPYSRPPSIGLPLADVVGRVGHDE